MRVQFKPGLIAAATNFMADSDMRRVRWLRPEDLDNDDDGITPLSLLPRHAAVGVRRAMPAADALQLAERVLQASDRLVDDFGGEQQALGRAFYTHLESGAASTYFAQQAASDAVVEAVLPGVQSKTLALLARLLGGTVRRRHGFCGPGVHVFPPGEKVAERGGVFHYDLEGLGRVEREVGVDGGARAVSLVWMLQQGRTRGGLSLFNTLYRGRNWDMDRVPTAQSTTTRALPGDVVLFSSYRLHRINGFGGDDARIAVTCHAVEVDRDVWECWF